jgi:hypothetical protein
VVAGRTSGKPCRPTPGRVEVCAAAYGANGWLGLARIWTNGDHITHATVKLNNTYFARAAYNTPAWRRYVMCHEVGHTFGLDHVNENDTDPNTGSCMDDTEGPTMGPGPGRDRGAARGGSRQPH